MDITATSDGGYVTVGARQLNPGELRAEIRRFDSAGNLLWSKTYSPGTGPSVLNAAQIHGSDIVAVGTAESPGNALATAALYLRVKLGDGAEIASKVIEIGTDSARLDGLVAVSATEVVVVGRASDPGASGNGADGWIAQLGLDGSPQWSNFVGGTGSDALVDVITSGNTVVAVGKDDNAAGLIKGLVVRVSLADGGVQKQVSLTKATGSTVFSTVAQLPTGQLVVGGGCDTGQAVAKTYQAAVARLSADFALQSLTIFAAVTPKAPKFAGLKTSMIEALRVRPDGSLFAVGSTGSAAEPLGKIDGAMWQIASDDKLLGAWYFGAEGTDSLRGVIARKSGWLAGGAMAELAPDSESLRVLLSFPKPDCDDFDPCTVDQCTASQGCMHTSLAEGATCGPGAICKSGKCLSP